MKAVQDILDARIASSAEVGLQVAAYHRDELIVDACAGTTARGGSQPVTSDTLFCLFSASKGVTATAVHAAVENGHLGYDDPVAQHWPEFGVHGKSTITVRQVLCHTAGLHDTPLGVEPQNWDLMCWAITLMSPAFEPGTATAYSGMTFGWILGELLHHATGHSIGDLVQDFGIPDLHYGVPSSELGRVAVLSNDDSMTVGPYADYATRYFAPAFNRDEIRQASIPAAGVIGTAVSLARLYAGLVGDAPGLLPVERIAEATALQTEEVDRVAGIGLKKGLGYLLGGPDTAMPNRASAFGHPGHGGAFGFADPEHELSFALTKNHLVQAVDPTTSVAYEVAHALRAELGIPS